MHKDWTLWGPALGEEGKTVLAFLTASSGCSCSVVIQLYLVWCIKIIILTHYTTLVPCLRCKMMVQARPKAWVHENVLQCPAKEMLESVLGYFDDFSICIVWILKQNFGVCEIYIYVCVFL